MVVQNVEKFKGYKYFYKALYVKLTVGENIEMLDFATSSWVHVYLYSSSTSLQWIPNLEKMFSSPTLKKYAQFISSGDTEFK